MTAMLGNLQGAIYQADSNGMLLATSGSSPDFDVVPASAYKDDYVKFGDRTITKALSSYSSITESGNFWYLENVVSTTVTDLGKYGDGFFSVAVLLRNPLYASLDSHVNMTFLGLLFTASFFHMFYSFVLRHCVLEETSDAILNLIYINKGSNQLNKKKLK